MKLVKDLFAEYALAMSNYDIDGIRKCFANEFTFLSPDETKSYKNNKDFAHELKSSGEFYRGIGTQNVRVGAINEKAIDNYFSLVDVEWILLDEKEREMVRFNTSYLVGPEAGDLRIFAYTQGDGIEKLKEKGLWPEEEKKEHHWVFKARPRKEFVRESQR